MKKIFVLVAILMGLVSTGHTVKMKSIYSGEVLVASQEERLRAQAIQQAFAQTLTKVSGSSAVLQNPVITAALPKATQDVQEFAYAPSGDPKAPFLLKVKFDPRAVKQLLRQAKVPAWGENRPLILIWLSVEHGDHAVELLDSSSTSDVTALLKKRADQRGVPLLFPVMDVTDLAQVSAEAVRAMDVPALEKASFRYHTNGILMGNIQDGAKGMQSHWKLILGKRQWEWHFNDSAAAVLVEELMNKMTQVLEKRYAPLLSDQSTSSFTLVVKGISEQEDLGDLIHFIRHISLIKAFEVKNIMGDEVIMHLSVQGNRQDFMQNTAVEQHLHLEFDEGNELTYFWVR